jgi:hypothetical protein
VASQAADDFNLCATGSTVFLDISIGELNWQRTIPNKEK